MKPIVAKLEEVTRLVRTIKARVKGGVIQPLERIDLPEGKEIIVSIEETETLSNEERLRRFKATAGSWKDLVPESFIDEIYAQRKIRTRPEVKL